MSKKKKKKKSLSILKEIDTSLNYTHEDLMEEIQAMQLRLNKVDNQIRKKAKKMKKKGKEFDASKESRMVRQSLITEMEGSNFIDRATKTLKDIAPIVVVIGRLIASLILSILSLDIVKVNIKPDTLNRLNGLYQQAMSLA